MQINSVHIFLIIIIAGILLYWTWSPSVEAYMNTDGMRTNRVRMNTMSRMSRMSRTSPSERDQEDLAIAKLMVKLWVQYMIYTRLTMMAVLEADQDTDVRTAKLRQYAQDFGTVISKFYGEEAGNAIERMLNKHSEITLKIISTIRMNSDYDKNLAINELYINADQIGSYLDALSGNQEEAFKHQMKTFIDGLIANIIAYSTNNYKGDTQTLDTYIDSGIDLAFHMAKM